MFNILEYFIGNTCLMICYVTLIDKNGLSVRKVDICYIFIQNLLGGNLC